MKWVTRARPKTDRIACPWLIKNLPLVDYQLLRARLSRSSAVVQHLLTNTRTRFRLYSTEPFRSANGVTASAAISPATRA